MKKISILLIAISLIVFSFHARAITHIVTVQDFSFSPSSITLNVGDTVTWTWVNGLHTTTSTEVPAGASTWDQPINSLSTSFSYVVMVPGSYNYDCSIHPTQMTGSFTASLTSGISTIAGGSDLAVNTAVVSNQLYVSYTLPKQASPDIFIYDLAGSEEYHFTSGLHAPGSYNAVYSLGNLSKGMYFIELRAGDIRMTKKIVVE